MLHAPGAPAREDPTPREAPGHSPWRWLHSSFIPERPSSALTPHMQYGHLASVRTYYLLGLADLKLGLDDLFTQRHAALTISKVAQGSEDLLAFQRSEINGLPAALTGGKPLAEELATTDEDHDGFGMGLWHITEAYERAPSTSPKVLAAIRRIRAGLIPSTRDLRSSYADEAEAAIRRKEDLPSLEADLKSIPLAEGATLHDWAVSYLGSGEKLSMLLSQRADLSVSKRKNAQILRSETVGMLNDLRVGIAREMKRNPNLPRDLDASIFGYFDTLEAQREAQNRAAKAAKAAQASEKTEGA